MEQLEPEPLHSSLQKRAVNQGRAKYRRLQAFLGIGFRSVRFKWFLPRAGSRSVFNIDTRTKPENVLLDASSRAASTTLKREQRKLEALKELLPKIPVHSIQVVEDSEKQFCCEIHLDDGQKALGRQLFDAGRMNILFSKRGELPGSYAWGIDALDKGIENDTCSVHLYFNLEYEYRSSESIIRNDLATRSLTLWRNFVSEQNVSQSEIESVTSTTAPIR